MLVRGRPWNSSAERCKIERFARCVLRTLVMQRIIRSLGHLCVYYESLKRALKTKTIYGYRCDERLKTNVEESIRLACTPFCAELEHLKTETRLTSETPVSEMGEYASVM